jgi:hypothetical protein
VVRLIIDELQTFTPLEWTITGIYFGIGTLSLLAVVL